MLALPLMTMAALPFVLLPRWRIVEYDDGSTPLSPEYKAWWTEHRHLCREHAQRCAVPYAKAPACGGEAFGARQEYSRPSGETM